MSGKAAAHAPLTCSCLDDSSVSQKVVNNILRIFGLVRLTSNKLFDFGADPDPGIL